jgi:hypothetical protein
VSNAAGRALALIEQMDARIRAEQIAARTPDQIAATAGDLSKKIMGLIGKPNMAGECGKIGREIEEIGQQQDRVLANCRMSAKWITARCRDISSDDPKSKPMCDKILKEIEQILKKG